MQESRSETLEKFAQKEPGLETFELELERYDRIANAIDAMQASHVIGSLCVESGNLKEHMKREANEWKQLYVLVSLLTALCCVCIERRLLTPSLCAYRYGSRLNHNTKSRVKELMDFVEDTTAQLTRKVCAVFGAVNSSLLSFCACRIVCRAVAGGCQHHDEGVGEPPCHGG